MDDVDGSEAVVTVRFGLDGHVYEIDLNEAHAEDLREVFAPYAVAARLRWSPRQFAEGLYSQVARGSRPGRQGGPRVGHREGFQVNARGRLKAEVAEQYRAAGHLSEPSQAAVLVTPE